MFLCVTGAPQVEEIVNGKDGIAAAARKGLVVVDTSTSEPATTTKMRESLAGAGVLFVDAPLARTPVEAELGKLNIMVGADDATFAALKPVLQAFCENIIHAGPPGHGLMIKLINNFVAQAIATATAEACATAAKAGVSLRKVHEVISAGAVNSGIFQMMVGKMLDNHGDLTGLKFTLVNAMKDLRYYTHFAESLPGVRHRRRGGAPEPRQREPAGLRRQVRRVADRSAGEARRRGDRAALTPSPRPDRQLASEAARSRRHAIPRPTCGRRGARAPLRGHRLHARPHTGALAFGVDVRAGNRDPGIAPGLGALADGDWDAVIDTSGYLPRCVSASTRLLAERVPHYLFVSSLSVYADGSVAGQDESAARRGTRRSGVSEDIAARLRRIEGGLRAAGASRRSTSAPTSSVLD